MQNHSLALKFLFVMMYKGGNVAWLFYTWGKSDQFSIYLEPVITPCHMLGTRNMMIIMVVVEMLSCQVLHVVLFIQMNSLNPFDHPMKEI
jgi:hypothetical protein